MGDADPVTDCIQALTTWNQQNQTALRHLREELATANNNAERTSASLASLPTLSARIHALEEEIEKHKADSLEHTAVVTSLQDNLHNKDAVIATLQKQVQDTMDSLRAVQAQLQQANADLATKTEDLLQTRQALVAARAAAAMEQAVPISA